MIRASVRPACWLAPIAAFTAMTAAAAEWATVPEAGSVTMYATKQGALLTGVFGEFTAVIDFDPATPDTGRIVGIVKTGSVETHDDQNNNYVRGYLDVEAFPEARFESTAIEQTADGYRASGELTLTGTTNAAALDFSFTPGAEASGHARATFRGTMTINRFDYDIAADVDTSWAGQDVSVLVELVLEQ
jgi:polyisoprenoid-binding protein YceI